MPKDVGNNFGEDQETIIYHCWEVFNDVFANINIGNSAKLEGILTTNHVNF